MQILDSISSEPLSILKGRHVLVDTNFLIDGFHYPDIFWELINDLRKKDSILFTISAVKYEFMRGSKSIGNYKKKIDYFQKVIETVHPIGKQEVDIVENLTRALLKQSASISYIDCLLFATVIGITSPVYLLTSDQSDVPLSIFDIKATVGIDIEDRNCIYAFYVFNREKYKHVLESLLSGEL
jgi:rRNA-processing protein FCF1